MSVPLRMTPRPVKRLRAAPTAKWDTMAIEKAVQAAARAGRTRNGATGMSAPTAVAAPVSHPSLNGLAHLLPQRALRILHDLRGHALRGPGIDTLGLVEQRELFLLHVGHQADLFFLHRDLVRVHLFLALRGEIAGGAHRERIRDHPGESRHQHDVRRHFRADHPRHEPKVGRQAVVEAVYDVTQESAGRGPMPRLGASAGEARQRAGCDAECRSM